MKTVRWIALSACILAALILLAGFILPKFIDLQTYKPKIEQVVTEATGRPFSMGDNIELSIFPWLGVRLSDLRLGTPKGFQSAEFISVKNFEARIKLFPLFKKQIEIGKVIVESPKIYLEKTKSGENNWANLGAADSGKHTVPTQKKERTATPKAADDSGFAISSLKIETFAIKNGLVRFTDKKNKEVKTVRDLNLSVAGVGQKKPVQLILSGRLNDMPLELSGTVGPTGKLSGKEDMDITLLVRVLDKLECQLKGHVSDPSGKLAFNGSIELKSFSPRELMAALGNKFPVTTADKDVLKKLSFTSQISATTQAVFLSEAKIKLDNSTLRLNVDIKEFEHPDIKAKIRLDHMDIDRYLPPAQTQAAKKDTTKIPATPQQAKAKVNPTPQKLRLTLQLDTGPLKVANVKFDTTHLKLTGKNGVFRVSPLRIKLYEGDIDMTARADMNRLAIKTEATLALQNIQAGPLLQDSANFTKVEGRLCGTLKINAQGNNADTILRTAAGQGKLLFTEGGIVGVDLTNILQNAVAKLKGQKQQPKQKVRTDFSKLSVPFSLGQGIATLKDASLISPLLRLVAVGKVDLPDKNLDVRITPKFVGTLKGQGDKKDRLGATVPLKITGSFSNPKIRPDLKATVKDALVNPDQTRKRLQKNIKRETRSLQKNLKKMLKGF